MIPLCREMASETWCHHHGERPTGTASRQALSAALSACLPMACFTVEIYTSLAPRRDKRYHPKFKVAPVNFCQRARLGFPCPPFSPSSVDFTVQQRRYGPQTYIRATTYLRGKMASRLSSSPTSTAKLWPSCALGTERARHNRKPNRSRNWSADSANVPNWWRRHTQIVLSW
jgi:hypothetical protein